MIDSLWSKRAVRFWKETAPYFQYALMGGLTTTAALLFIAGSYWYARLLRDFPNQFQYVWIMAPVLALFIFNGKIRTYLLRADLTHLLPYEARMNTYFKPAFRFAYFMQTIFFLVAAMLLMLLHKAGSLAVYGREVTAAELVFLLAALLVMKWHSIFAYWREAQLRDSEWRYAVKTARLLITVVAAYLLLTIPLAQAVLASSLLMLCHLVLFLFLPSFYLNWEYLVQAEETARARIYQFLSWFIDVPSDSKGSIKRRAYLNPFSKLIKLNRNNTFLFLYWKTMQRSEIFGIVFRLALFGIICIAVFSHPYWKIASFFFFSFLTAAQLSSINAFHKYLVWMHVYPLPDESRQQSAVNLAWLTHVIFVLVIVVPLVLTAHIHAGWLVLIGGSAVIAARLYFNKKAKAISNV